MNQLQNILKLNTAERIIIIKKIWNTIHPEEIELNDSHKKELDKRLKRFNRGETNFFSWEEVKGRVKSRFIN